MTKWKLTTKFRTKAIVDNFHFENGVEIFLNILLS